MCTTGSSSTGIAVLKMDYICHCELPKSNCLKITLFPLKVLKLLLLVIYFLYFFFGTPAWGLGEVLTIPPCKTLMLRNTCRMIPLETLNDLYSSPNIVRVIKSRRMGWAGHVARMLRRGGCIGSWWVNRRERDHRGDLGVDGRIIFGWISGRWDVGIWTGFD